jgi:hypothetical protein
LDFDNQRREEKIMPEKFKVRDTVEIGKELVYPGGRTVTFLQALTDQKQFSQLVLSTYLDLELTVPSIVSKTYQGFAYSQMFLLGLVGDKPAGFNEKQNRTI